MNANILKYIKITFNILSVIGMIATIIGCFYLWKLGAFQDQTILRELILAHRYFGPIIFLFIQIMQVVVPIIPGGLTTAAGVLIFGPVMGFVYNYIGIVIGSIILFYFGRSFGQSLVKTFVKEKTYEKTMTWLAKGQKRFNLIFFLLILSPIAPDDALVLVASQTKMTWKFFNMTLIVAKPFGILLYSYALIYGGNVLSHFL